MKAFFNKLIANAPVVLALLVVDRKLGVSQKIAAALPPKNTPSA